MHLARTLLLLMILLCTTSARADFTPLTDHIRIDRDTRTIEIDATVVYERREVRSEETGELLYTFGDWLELLLCTTNTREHESLLATDAKPSDIHAALLLLGLQPGRPATPIQSPDGDWITAPPTGPELLITLSLANDPDASGIPAGGWITHQPTRATLEHTPWLFAGSRTITHEGNDLYLADLSGSVISLVAFRDDLITHPTTTSPADDDQAFQATPDLIPPPQTPILLRIRPADLPETGDADPDATPETPEVTQPPASR
ncbi:MAG: YdjY domain-containing protein [Phycisphaeraceae bacterium]